MYNFNVLFDQLKVLIHQNAKKVFLPISPDTKQESTTTVIMNVECSSFFLLFE